MTTPRPDEPLTVAEMHRLTAHLSPYDLALFSRAIAASHTAGRDQGLREAATKVRAILADCEARDIDDPELEHVAQDIEQLRGCDAVI